MARTMCRYVVLLLADLAVKDTFHALSLALGKEGVSVTDEALAGYVNDPNGRPQRAMRKRLSEAVNKLLERHPSFGSSTLPRQLINEAVCFDDLVQTKSTHPNDVKAQRIVLKKDMASYKQWASAISTTSPVQQLWFELLAYLAATELTETYGSEDKLQSAREHIALHSTDRRQATEGAIEAIDQVLETLGKLCDRTNLGFGALGLFLAVNGVVNVGQRYLPWERAHGHAGHTALSEAIDRYELFDRWRNAPELSKSPGILMNLLEVAQYANQPDLVREVWRELSSRHGTKASELEQRPLLCCARRLTASAPGTTPWQPVAPLGNCAADDCHHLAGMRSDASG